MPWRMCSGSPIPSAGRWSPPSLLLKNGADFDETTLRRQLAAELSVYKIPKRFAAVSTAEIPLLPSGKVNMRELKRVFDAR